jgi:hypothetical protein
MNSKKLLFAILFVFSFYETNAQIVAQYDFPAASSLVVSAKDANVTVSNFTISTGTITTNVTSGTYFPNEPYIESTGGWTSATQSGAKNFNFTITAAVGYTFSITNISFNAYSTLAGPSAFGYGINGTDIYSVNAPDSSLLGINQTVTGQSGLSSAVINIQGWLNGSRTSSGNGVFRIDDVIITGVVTPIVTGITTANNGNWNVGTTWTGGVVPTASQNAIINHNVTLDVNVTRNTGTVTTVNAGAGKSLSTGAFTYTNDGTTNVDGILNINNGGFVNGANNLVYGAASTLVIAHGSGVPYVVGAGQRFWPVANPPFNVSLAGNSPTQLNMVVGPVDGQLIIAAGLDVVTANALTVNGTLRINANGFINTNSPIYGAASTLTYNTGGTFGRGFEWRALGVGTIGVTPGYPNNVIVQNNTTLDYVNTLVPNAVGIKAIAGNLSIASGSALNMDTGGVAAGGALIVGGTVNVNGPAGALRLGTGANDDLKIGGNFFVTTTATFDGKQRKVFFTNNATTQFIAGPSITIPYLVFEPSSGSTSIALSATNLTISAPLGGNAITFSGSGTDYLDINSQTLTIGTAGVANVISGTGFFRGGISSTNSSLTLLGTGSIGTLTFSPVYENLKTFTVNRTSGAVACTMGSQLTVTSTMNLTAGIVDLNASTFTLNSGTTLTGASSSNYFIADDAFGGILRKGYTTTGNFTFPIGDKTGTMEYSPANFNLTAGTGMTASSYIGMSVNDSQHPNMTPASHYISRYWSVTRYGTINTPTYTFTGTYLPTDIVGTETSSLSQFWNGSAWSAVGTILAANTLTYGGCTYLPTSGANHHTGGRRDQEINIKQGATPIASGGSYNFGNVAAGSNSSVVFTIENLGNANLLLYSNTAVVAPFSLTTPLSYTVTISSMGTATFTIQFAPTTAGPFSGSISFFNNDSDEVNYVVNFTGNGTGSTTSDIINVAASEPATISSTNIGTIASITDGVEAWRFLLRDGGTVAADADALATTMTDLVITQNVNDAIGNWNESIADIVLVNLATNTIVAHGVVTNTQIQFNTISVVAADNTTVLLGLRLTLKCPLGVGALDGDKFVFTISNTNVTFAPSGSGKTAFAARTSLNTKNAIAIVATKLTFTTQPITTGVSVAMSNVVVMATDACGNKDKDKTGSVTLTSSGTMNPIGPISLSSGSATFTGITHTVVGTDFNLIATITGFTPEASTLFDISTITILNPGDLAVLAVNTNTGGTPAGTDEVAFVCFRDLLPGTNLFITDNGYERKSAGLWGGTEGVISITRTGSLLPKGTIITIRTTTANATSASHFDVYTCGAIDTNWSKTIIGGSGFNLNGDDDIYFMQGGVWTNDTGHASTYTGNVLYGWTESGWDLAPGGVSGDTKWSTLFPGMECFNTVAPPGDGFVKFNDPVDPDFSTTTNGKFDWIGLINNQANWNSYTDNADYIANGFDYAGGCTLVNLATSVYVNGKWSGRVDKNWFNCLNWETLIVPVATTDVIIPTAVNDAEIDAAAPFAVYSNYIAKTKNLTITGQKVTIKDNLANKLEVHGDLTIANTVADGALNMNGGTATDGQLYLYGNWNNNKNNDAFDEGKGKVHFMGALPQVINNVTPIGTEMFNDVILNNDFNTAVSNDLLLKGDLTLNIGKTLTIDSNGYATVYNKLTSNGTVMIQNNGQLIQVNDSDTNTGDYTSTTTRFQVLRNYTARDIDYVYWSAPTKLMAPSSLPTGNRYEWDPVYPNTNGTFGNWRVPTTPTMTEGKGYIARTYNGSGTSITLPFTFRGQPNNGSISIPIKRGAIQGLITDPPLSYPIVGSAIKWDDNWNLVGNPYPSAIKALTFLTVNTEIEGFVYLWSHGTAPSNAIADPFYYNFVLNYTSDDYIIYNGTGTVKGPVGFNGKIASGQGFFVLMKDGPAATGSVVFNNSMRMEPTNAIYDNSQFYRSTAATAIVTGDEEKHRIWLDIISPQNALKRTLVGYVDTATNEKDRLFDAVTKPNSLDIYSFMDNEDTQEFCIQGRALPFVSSDKVKLGINVAADGQYKIAIGAVDGLFTSGQNIYLEDKLLGIIHDLRETPYTFTTLRGMFNDRFVLRYTTQNLGAADFDFANQVIIATNHSQINITSKNETISEVQVFDMLGRAIYTKSNLDTLLHAISTQVKNQALIVKVTLTNGTLISKKVIVN